MPQIWYKPSDPLFLHTDVSHKEQLQDSKNMKLYSSDLYINGICAHLGGWYMLRTDGAYIALLWRHMLTEHNGILFNLQRKIMHEFNPSYILVPHSNIRSRKTKVNSRIYT
jgi:hypothetical protein